MKSLDVRVTTQSFFTTLALTSASPGSYGFGNLTADQILTNQVLTRFTKGRAIPPHRASSCFLTESPVAGSSSDCSQSPSLRAG